MTRRRSSTRSAYVELTKTWYRFFNLGKLAQPDRNSFLNARVPGPVSASVNPLQVRPAYTSLLPS